MVPKKLEKLLLLNICIILVLIIMNIGLFLRMNQIQGQFTQLFQPVESHQALGVGSQAPNFRGTDTTGNEISLGDFQGQSLLVVFSRISCPYCQQMYPNLVQFHQLHPEVSIVMFSKESAEKRNPELVKDQRFDFPVLSWVDDVIDSYKVPGTPFFYSIDNTGQIVSNGNAVTLEQIEKLASSTTRK